MIWARQCKLRTPLCPDDGHPRTLHARPKARPPLHACRAATVRLLPSPPSHTCARTHMHVLPAAPAEFFVEGMLRRLLDRADPVSRALLRDAVFYVVPCMCE